MRRVTARARFRSSTTDFFRSLLATLTALAAIHAVFIGLLLFAIGYATWPVGISVGGGIAFGMALYALSDLREELRWRRVGGSSGRRCAYCREPVAGRAFVASRRPYKGVLHSACFPEAFPRAEPLEAFAPEIARHA